MSDDKMIENAVVDHVQKIVDHAKSELEKIECPKHGQALQKLEFDKANGRFKIETCCSDGEGLVNQGIEKL
jgi:hypothetical protein